MSSAKRKVYIAGPMRGIPEFNYPAFFKAQAYLERHGAEVYNPAEMDGYNTSNLTGRLDELPAFCMREAMQRNCTAILMSDAIYMLNNWEGSLGAQAEHALAVCAGLDIMYQFQFEEELP